MDALPFEFDKGPVNKFPFQPYLPSGNQRVASVGGSNGFPMCDKCDELDKKIEHYSRMLLSIGDQITVDRIKSMIADL